jgi:hypothetical protein
MSKKDSTKKTPARKSDTAQNKARNLRAIAEHVAAILSNPATPCQLYDAVLEGVMALDCTCEVYGNANHVEAILLTFAQVKGGRGQ